MDFLDRGGNIASILPKTIELTIVFKTCISNNPENICACPRKSTFPVTNKTPFLHY